MDIVLAGPNAFEFEPAKEWVYEKRTFMLQMIGAYLTGLYVLKKAMHKREPYDLQVFLVLWNLALAVFSTLGMIALATEYLDTYTQWGFLGTYCYNNQLFRGTTGYWVYMFTVSKLFELGDSFFLVLRKRPLSFLQWYHHALTLFYCWWSYSSEPVFQRIGTLTNYTVHSAMYTYFFLRALKIRVPPVIARGVTGLQIVQFAMAITLMTHGLYRNTLGGETCDWPLDVSYLAFAMNITYLILFVNFFVQAYCKRQHSSYKAGKAE